MQNIPSKDVKTQRLFNELLYSFYNVRYEKYLDIHTIFPV